MSALGRPGRERPRRSRRSRNPALRAVLAAGALLLVFLLGMAVARTLDERPANGDVVTNVRTLEPLGQRPAETVTVTVTSPG